MRRHDLDRPRVRLFALLVPHHASVGFAPLGADIHGVADDRLGGDALALWVCFTHTLRPPALFLLAGIGTWVATARGAGARFAGRRPGPARPARGDLSRLLPGLAERDSPLNHNRYTCCISR